MHARARSVTAAAAAVAAAVGLVVLVVGWWFGVDIVTRVLPGLVSMKANTALGFLLLGIALWPTVRERSRGLAHAVALVVAALGAATLVEYVGGVDLGIDQLLAEDSGGAGTSSPGRMGLNTALGFLLLGGAVVLAEPRRAASSRVAAQVAGIAVLLLSTLALLGYVLGASSAVGIGSATEMALHTSVLFVVTSCALLATTLDVGVLRPLSSDLPAGSTARQVVPTVVGGLLLSVFGVNLLAITGLVEDRALQLAIGSTLALAVAALAILGVLGGTVRSESRELALRRDLEAVRSAFPDVHLRIGPHDRLLSVHGPVHELGLTRADVGDRLDMVLHPAAVDAIRPVLADVRETSRRRTVTYVGPEGERTLEANVVPFSEGQVAVAIRDITELAETQRELTELTATLERQVAERTADLEAANRDLERFAYLASHDLQEPLRMVTGFVSRIGDRYGDVLDERGQQYVHFAVDGAERMQRLIEGLLAYSRAGHLSDERIDRLDLAEVVRDVLAVTEVEEGGRVERNLDPAEVEGDPVLLRQVVQNLVSNALKFTRPGVPPHVRIGTALRGGDAVVWVQDNGIGIKPENRREVFEMFRRFSGAQEHRGTGIGLSLVQQIVRAHGGHVEVDDAPGHGTRFTVVLPRRGARDGTSTASSTRAAGGGQPG